MQHRALLAALNAALGPIVKPALKGESEETRRDREQHSERLRHNPHTQGAINARACILNGHKLRQSFELEANKFLDFNERERTAAAREADLAQREADLEQQLAQHEADIAAREDALRASTPTPAPNAPSQFGG